MTRRAPGALLALALAACGSGVGGNETTNSPGAEARQERPIPCAVEQHGMSEAELDRPREPGTPYCDESVDPETIPLDELVRIIPAQHPAFYYILATRLFEANRKEEAVFWFYAGQLRYRIRLACHPDLAPDTEPALFASLQEVVGRTVNEHAGADPDAWVATMERALAWDEATANGFEPKEPCAAHIADQRGGMGALIDQVRQNKDQIRAERAARGLPNR